MPRFGNVLKCTHLARGALACVFRMRWPVVCKIWSSFLEKPALFPFGLAWASEVNRRNEMFGASLSTSVLKARMLYRCQEESYEITSMQERFDNMTPYLRPYV